MRITPAPRFIHVIAIERAETKVGALHVVQQACPLARVVTNASDKLKLAAGDIVMFPMENANVIAIDEDGLNLVLFEDAILGWVPRQDVEAVFPGGFRDATAHVISASNPGPGIVTPRGVRIPNRN